MTSSDSGTAREAEAGDQVPVDDGLWELGLGALLFCLAVTLDTGRMPVYFVVAIPLVAGLLRWGIVRPRIAPAAFRHQLAVLRLGPLALLCALVIVGALVIGTMARGGGEAFEPAQSAVPGVAAAAILALAVLSALLGARMRAARYLVWAGLAVVGLLLDPIAAPRARAWALALLSLVIVGSGTWRLSRLLRRPPASGDRPGH